MPRPKVQSTAAAIIAGLALLLGQAGSTVAVPVLSVGPNVDISGFADNESETTVAVNPTNSDNIVVISNFARIDGLMKAVSFDGGTTWTSGVIADGSTDLGTACCDPNGSFDAYGNYFLVYLDLRAKKVQTAYSTDGGTTLHFLATIDHSDNSTPTNNGQKWGAGTDQPSLATGPGGTWFVYKPYSTGGHLLTVRGLHVTGLGQLGAWTAPETVPGPKHCTYGDIAVGPDGQVLNACQEDESGQGPERIFTNVDPDGFGPAGFGPARVATWTNVGGFDYIPAQSGRSIDAEAGLAYDRTGGAHAGRVYLVYTDETPDESNNTDIYVRYSDDDGATWSAPTKVNDDAGVNSQFNPHISLDPTSGYVAVGFHDARNDLGLGGPGDTDGIPNDDAQYWLTVSKDGGATWAANVQVSAGTSNAADAHNGIDYGDYTGLSFYGGVIHPAWADNSNSTGTNPDGALSRFDVYSAAVTVH
ncbi:MAG TPA: hypothetical protein VKR30_07570 [Candidatus Limnocylindrales bacterium]|nr:hypothetical protein [Candidatus Limnocylindrales bacterium]